MAGRFHREPREPVRIVVAVGQAIERAIEPVARVPKLRLKFRRHFCTHLVAARADAWPQCRNDVRGPRAEFHLHAPQSFFRNPANGPAPSGMDRSDGAPFCIGKQNRNAIGGLHHQQDARLASNQSVASRRYLGGIARSSAVIRRTHNVDDIGMNLPERNNLHFAGAQAAEEFLAVCEHALARIPVGKAKVQNFLGRFLASAPAVAKSSKRARSAGPCAEAVNEPVEPRECRCFENLQAAASSKFPMGDGRGTALCGDALALGMFFLCDSRFHFDSPETRAGFIRPARRLSIIGIIASRCRLRRVARSAISAIEKPRKGNGSVIVGLGLDIAEIDRIKAAITRHGAPFIERVYTPLEAAYCETYRNKFERYAGRFAAKEAAMKALGTGWRNGVRWRDIEVVREPSGKPTLQLAGVTKELAGRMGVKNISLTITHSGNLALAEVIFENGE